MPFVSRLFAIVLACLLIARPVLADDFAACGVDLQKHSQYKCFAVDLKYKQGLLGRPNGNTVEIFMMGHECEDFTFSKTYNGRGLKQVKAIGPLACRDKIIYWNGKPVARYGGELIN
jgi:hypothetical protein